MPLSLPPFQKLYNLFPLIAPFPTLGNTLVVGQSNHLYNNNINDLDEADDDDMGNEDEDDEYNEITEAPTLPSSSMPVVPMKNLMPDPPNLSGIEILSRRYLIASCLGFRRSLLSPSP